MPVTPQLLENYRSWLHFEHRALAWELAEGDGYAFKVLLNEHRVNSVGGRFHLTGVPQPSARAAVILSAAGVALV